MNEHQNVDQCIPRQNNRELSAYNQNSESTCKISSKRKAADAEQALNMKRKRDENDRKKIANEDAKKREKRTQGKASFNKASL